MVGRISDFRRGLVLAAACRAFVCAPWGNVRNVDAEGEMLGGAEVPQDVRQTLETEMRGLPLEPHALAGVQQAAAGYRG